MKNSHFKFLTTFCLVVFGLFLLMESEKPHHEKQSLRIKREREKDQKENNNIQSLNSKEKRILKIFIQKRDLLLETMPHKSDLQEEQAVHHAPESLIQHAKEIAEIKELVIRNKELSPLREAALEFYHGCSDNPDFPTSIRSVCLYNRLTLAKTMGQSVDISKYPLEMKRLVLQLKPF